jgi:F-type H+-transporting ATPase subunit b
LEFDWTTFLLEIVNFLILIWLLQRFLYRPVQTAIQRRQAAIEQALSQARDAKAEGEALRQQYENRLVEWEQEREKARSQLSEKINVERTQRLEALHAEVAHEQERSRVLEERRADERRQRVEEEAAMRASLFGARLLARLATPGLEARIVEIVLKDLRGLPAEKREPLRVACREHDARITVTSTYPLGADHRAMLIDALGELADGTVACEFAEDVTLIAGVRVGIGPWVLRANLRDELSFFAETTHGPPE